MQAQTCAARYLLIVVIWTCYSLPIFIGVPKTKNLPSVTRGRGEPMG
jgi:hypothetical protein